jgi:hypothetical protein
VSAVSAGSETALAELHHHFIYVAPGPEFARLYGPHHRMMSCCEMLRGVLVFRVVAAPNVTADEALAQVHPCISDFDALFAAHPISSRCAFDGLQVIEVMTTHASSSLAAMDGTIRTSAERQQDLHRSLKMAQSR